MFNYRADNAGNIPAVGDFVAYNYSGQIATGWILFIGKGGRIKIHQVHPKEGHISWVKGGAKCVLVIQKKED